jgi:hypothetical protein
VRRSPESWLNVNLIFDYPSQRKIKTDEEKTNRWKGLDNNRVQNICDYFSRVAELLGVGHIADIAVFR